MDDQTQSSLVFAFDPGHGANTPTVYRRDADSPEEANDIPNATSKIAKAVDNLPRPMEAYDPPEEETFWIRYEYASLVDDDRVANRVYDNDAETEQ